MSRSHASPLQPQLSFLASLPPSTFDQALSLLQWLIWSAWIVCSYFQNACLRFLARKLIAILDSRSLMHLSLGIDSLSIQTVTLQHIHTIRSVDGRRGSQIAQRWRCPPQTAQRELYWTVCSQTRDTVALCVQDIMFRVSSPKELRSGHTEEKCSKPGSLFFFANGQAFRNWLYFPSNHNVDR